MGFCQGGVLCDGGFVRVGYCQGGVLSGWSFVLDSSISCVTQVSYY